MENMTTYIIIALTAITSIRAFNDYAIFDKLKFNAAHIQSSREWYRFFSYGLVHADWVHLGLNMFVLYAFSEVVLHVFGLHFGNFANMLYLLIYVSALGVSTMASFFKNRNNYAYNAVGASGAVSAILYASILVYPIGGIRFFFIPIEIPAWIFGILYLAYSAYMSRKNIDNIGHDAHFWGAVWGFTLPLAFKPELLKKFWELIMYAYF